MSFNDTLEILPVILSRSFLVINILVVLVSGFLLCSIYDFQETPSSSSTWTNFGREYYLSYNLFTSLLWSIEVFRTVHLNFDFRRWIFQLIFVTYCAIQSSALIFFVAENELYQDQKVIEEADIFIRMVAYLIDSCLELMYIYSCYIYTDPFGVYDPLGEVDVRVAQHL
jgi:hypothetical protein